MQIIKSTFDSKKDEEIYLNLAEEFSQLPDNKEKQKALVFLADYAERIGLYSAAAKHYLDAASIGLIGKTELYLHAIKASILACDIPSAFEIQEILSNMENYLPENNESTFLVYSAWLQIQAWFYAYPNIQLDTVLASIRKYTHQAKFSEFHPALLLTLWWIDSDKAAESTLLKKFPNSIETAAVKGEVTISPTTFWYLMPKNKPSEFANTEPDNITNNQTEPVGTPSAYQLGFFKNKENAQDLLASLQKKGFFAFIDTEKRKSGILYFIVLVKETENGKIGLMLKDAGYECYPIFD